jgi:hypothetical protein
LACGSASGAHSLNSSSLGTDSGGPSRARAPSTHPARIAAIIHCSSMRSRSGSLVKTLIGARRLMCAGQAELLCCTCIEPFGPDLVRHCVSRTNDVTTCDAAPPVSSSSPHERPDGPSAPISPQRSPWPSAPPASHTACDRSSNWSKQCSKGPTFDQKVAPTFTEQDVGGGEGDAVWLLPPVPLGGPPDTAAGAERFGGVLAFRVARLRNGDLSGLLAGEE